MGFGADAAGESWLEQAQRVADQTAPDTEERLSAMLLVNLAVFHSDFELALAMTETSESDHLNDNLNATRAAQARALQATTHEPQKQSISKNKQLARWRRFTNHLGLAVLIAFAAFCVFSGLRLRRVNRQLVLQINEVHRGREMREALEQKVAQIERMDSLGMLAGGVAHDFNNLLIGVLCNAEVLKSHPPDELADDCIDGIIRSAQAAAELSHKMLTYAGKRASEKIAFDLNQLIGELLPLLTVGSGDV